MIHEFDAQKEQVIPNVEGKIVFEKQFDLSIPEPVDVEKLCLDKGWVTLIEGENTGGIYSYQPPMSKLIYAAKAMVREIAERHGFEEHTFPRHYNRSDLHAFGWIEHDHLSRELMVTTPLNTSEGRTNHELLSDPVQCLGFYTTLREVQCRNGGNLPSKLFDQGFFGVYEDQGGWTLRNEIKARLQKGWSTAFEFSGAEIVFAGYENDVYAIRWRMLLAMLSLMDELQLTYRVVTSGSCARDESSPDLIGKEMRMYEIPTLDVELYIPQYANTDKSPWIEIGGGDVAGTRLVDNFNLKTLNGNALFSGCQGFGWQRFCLGLLSQKGLDPSNWSTAITQYYGSTVPQSMIGELMLSL
ncbi:MAG: hypothetical protein ACPG8W_13615 [Candidatus Promineifilaceae bacterium]